MEGKKRDGRLLPSKWARVFMRAILSKGSPFSVRDLEKEALKLLGPDFDRSELNSIIRRLVDRGILKFWPSEGENLLLLVGEEFLKQLQKEARQALLDEFFKKSITEGVTAETLDEVQLRLEKTEEYTIPQFYDFLIRFGIDASKVIRSVALETDFFRRNPRELLEEMLHDCVELHNKFYRLYLNETSARKKREYEKAMKRIRAIVRSVFGRYLQIPCGPQNTLKGAIIVIPDEESGKIEVRDWNAVKKLIEKRVLDDRVLVEYVPNKGSIFDGVDSSAVTIRPPIGRSIPSFKIFTQVTVTITSGEEKPHVTIKPKPEEVALSKLETLEKQGYAIPGHALLAFSDYYIDRIQEAIMQKQQYRAARSSITGEDGSEGESISEAVYLDGRIWPTEHKFSDFFAEHKDYVKAMLREFVRLTTDFGEDGPKVLGVVKRGHLGFLWYLIFWYAYKNGKVGLEAFVLEPRLYESLENRDGAVAFWLLILHHKQTGRYGRLFAVRRKLYAADLEILRVFLKVARVRGKNIWDAEEDFGFWKTVVEEAVISRKYGDTIEELERALEGRVPVEDLDLTPDLKEAIRSAIERVDESSLETLLHDLRSCKLNSEKYQLLKTFLQKDLLKKEDKELINILTRVYAFSDVASFYFLPPLQYKRDFIELFASDARFEPGEMPLVSLPRIDLLLPVHSWRLLGDIDPERLREYINSSIFESDKEMKLYVWYDTREGVSWNLLVPSPVKLAHIYSKQLNRREVAPMYAAIIVAYISKLRALAREKNGSKNAE